MTPTKRKHLTATRELASLAAEAARPRLRLVDIYFQTVAARGDTPRPVYVVLDAEGTMAFWSLSRREADRKALERGGTCRVEKVLP